MLDPLALRLFVDVARLGSLSAAGRELGYTQPAVTYQLHNLERAVGAPLTTRRGRETVLTDAGRELLSHAEHILSAMHNAEQALSVFAGGPRGTVRLAAFPSCYATLVSEAVADVRSLFPDLRMTLTQAEPSEAGRQVRAGQADIAITYRFAASALDPAGRSGRSTERSEQRPGLTRIPLFDDRMAVVVPSDHPAAEESTVTLADLAADTFLISSDRFASMLTTAGELHGFVPRSMTVADDYVAMQAMVALRMGVALIPELALAAHRDTRTVARPLPDWPDRVVEIVVWPDSLRLDSIAAVLDGLHRAAGRLAARRAAG